MNNANKLIVPMHKENVKQLIHSMPLILTGAIVWIFLLNLTYFTLSFISDYIFSAILLNLIFYIQIAIYSFIGLLVFLSTRNYYFVDDNTPAAILDKNGIWTKRCGLIPWENIAQVKICNLPTVKHIEFVGIYVKDTKILSKQSTWSKKIGIFWEKIFRYDKLFNYPNIALGNIAVSNDEIIKFARQFVPEK